MSDPLQRILQIQQLRGRPARDPSISEVVGRAARDATRSHKRLSRLVDLWEEMVPAETARFTRITSYRSGVLYVEVASSAAGFEIDRLLREGLLVALRERSPVTIRSVKRRVGSSRRFD